MKIHFLLIGTSLSLIPQTINAQCVATQDCATLGYTETSCSGGSGIKCPFGNKWACFKSESKICQQYGFTQSCTGTGYTGTVGKACNGKYSECTCASGYIWKDNSCQALNGAQGELQYCNGTLVGVKTSNMNFYVALKVLGEMNWYQAKDQCSNYAFCGDLKGSLPTLDQLKTIYNNKSSLNSLLLKYGGSAFTGSDYWSTTYNGYYKSYWVLDMSNGRTDGNTNYYRVSTYAHPVLASYQFFLPRHGASIALPLPQSAHSQIRGSSWHSLCPRGLPASTGTVAAQPEN